MHAHSIKQTYKHCSCIHMHMHLIHLSFSSPCDSAETAAMMVGLYFNKGVLLSPIMYLLVILHAVGSCMSMAIIAIAWNSLIVHLSLMRHWDI